jgi:hypothetical protein
MLLAEIVYCAKTQHLQHINDQKARVLSRLSLLQQQLSITIGFVSSTGDNHCKYIHTLSMFINFIWKYFLFITLFFKQP